MTQVEATKRKRSGPLARWFSRALVVAGGTIAGTAAACAISTAGASAEPADVDSAAPAPAGVSVEDAPHAERLAPVTNNMVDGLNDATHGCADLIGDVSGAAADAVAQVEHPDREAQNQAEHRDGAQTEASYQGASESDDADSVNQADRSVSHGANQAGGAVTEGTARPHEAGPDPDSGGATATDQDTPDRASSSVREHRQHRPVQRVIDQETADQVSDAVQDFTNDAVYEPIRKTAGSVEHVMREPQDAPRVVAQHMAPEGTFPDFGKSMWHVLDPHGDDDALTETPDQQPGDRGDDTSSKPRDADGAGGVNGVDGVDGVGTAAPGPSADPLPPAPAVADAGHSQPQPHAAPGVTPQHTKQADQDQPAPLPGAPAGVPMAPATGPVGPTGGGGHLDGLLFGVLAGPVQAMDPGVLGTVRSASGYLPTEPGSAPGVTPD